MGVDSSLTSIFLVSSFTGVETVKEREETSPAHVDTILLAACGIGAGDDDEIIQWITCHITFTLPGL